MASPTNQTTARNAYSSRCDASCSDRAAQKSNRRAEAILPILVLATTYLSAVGAMVAIFASAG